MILFPTNVVFHPLKIVLVLAYSIDSYEMHLKHKILGNNSGTTHYYSLHGSYLTDQRIS